MAFSTVPRCPAIYIASFFYWLLIGAAMLGVSIALSIAWVSALTVIPFFISILAGFRFFFGITVALGFTWLAILGLLVALLKAGQAGMFIRLHQGDRPRLSDFGAGVVRYTWRFLKGYFHLIALIAIPVIFFYGWLVLRYASYSSLIWESRWNMGLRFEFIHSVNTTWGFVLFLSALIYLFLLVWDESVVLEGSTFQQGYIRSARFTVRNPVRVIAVVLINLIIIYLLWLLTYRLYTLSPIFGLNDIINETAKFIYHQLWFILLVFIASPILSYTHFLLYIPNLPFTPGKRKVEEETVVPEVIKAKPGNEEADFVDIDPEEPGPRTISTTVDEENQIIAEKEGKPEDTSIDNDRGTEPDDDILRLNE